MLSKRYESTEVDRRTWLHVSLGTFCPTAVTLTKYTLGTRVKRHG